MESGKDWRNIWTLSEQKNGHLHPVSFELLARGRQLADQRGCELGAVVLCDQISTAEIHELIMHGADQVYVVSHPHLVNFLVENYSRALQYLVEKFKPEVFIAAATTTGRTVMPYLSIMVHAGLTADCTGLEIDPEHGGLLQTRPAIGGNIMATIRTPTARPQMATVRPKSTRPLAREPNRVGKVVDVILPEGMLNARTVHEQFIPDESQEISIDEANIIVAGGKGVRSSDRFCVICDLADALGGSVGASRVPVDHGWQPYPRQIGLSGKTVTPDLYIACGISGAIQHLAGMQTSKTIVAINSDPNAPIFQVSDFGVVANLFDFIPFLVEKIRSARKAGDSSRPVSPAVG